jgi:hypothetical protein
MPGIFGDNPDTNNDVDQDATPQGPQDNQDQQQTQGPDNAQQGQPSQTADVGNDGGQPSQQNQQPDQQDDEKILGKFDTNEDVYKAYRDLEHKLGSDAQEKHAMRQQLSNYQQQLARMAQYLQQQAQQSNQQPVASNQNAQGQSDQPDQGVEQIDREQWLESFYEKGPDAVTELARKVADDEIKRQTEDLNKSLQQLQEQQLAPLQQYVAWDQSTRNFGRQIQQAKQKYNDFDQYRPSIAQVIREMPELANRPDCMERAYQLAKAGGFNQQQQQAMQANQQAPQQQMPVQNQQQQQQQGRQKQAARMPASTGTRPGNLQEPSPEDVIRDRVFGSGAERKGIFG